MFWRVRSVPRHGRGHSLAGTLIVLLLVVVGPVPSASAGEVVETYDDGSPKARYLTNDQGQRQGPYTAYHPNGKVALEATYRGDQLDGGYVAYHANGRRRVRASYKAGKKTGRYEEYGEDGGLVVSSNYLEDRLHGKLAAYRGDEVVSNQVWRDGELVLLDGITAHPVAIDVLRKTVPAILAGEPTVPPPAKPKGKSRKPTPAPAAPSPPTELEKQRVAALRRLQAHRYVCGVPHEGLVLGDEANAHAQAAAELCARVGRIDHDPPNPGLPDGKYQFSLKGTKACNLHQNRDLPTSVDGYMDDSDPSNEKRVGHRSWCLNPGMLVTGFGSALGADGKEFTAMWAPDRSRVPIPDYEAVCCPARGWMPIDYFGEGRVWSVTPNPAKFPNVPADGEGVAVRVFRLGPDFVRPEAPLELDLFAVEGEFGAGPCVIFRPKGVEVVDGAAYWVEISGLEGKGKKVGERSKRVAEPSLRYVVQFCGPVLPGPGDAPPEGPK